MVYKSKNRARKKDKQHITEQVCTECETLKSLDYFSVDKRRFCGRGTKCLDCVKKIREIYYDKYPEAERRDRLKTAEFGKLWYEKNRDSCLIKMRNTTLLRKYNITEKDYQTILKSQNYCCAICKSTDPGRADKNFKVDHNHITKEVRGLLCNNCNAGLGFFSDNLDLLVEAEIYLKKETK
jgi:hypothetical protein